MTTNPIHVRLDAEVKRLDAEREDPTSGVSDLFIEGATHAADIAHEMGAQQATALSLLRDRFVTAARTLAADSDSYDTGSHDKARLRGKAEGVRLAMSYLDEILRENGDQS